MITKLLMAIGLAALWGSGAQAAQITFGPSSQSITSPGASLMRGHANLASLGPPAAEGLGDAEHDELGDGYALDEQEGTVSAEHAERAFRLACPVRGQDTRGRLDQLKILVGSSG